MSANQERNPIQEFREKLKLTKDEFAKKIGRSKSMVTKMEAQDNIKNKRFPSMITIKRIKKLSVRHKIPFDINSLIK